MHMSSVSPRSPRWHDLLLPCGFAATRNALHAVHATKQVFQLHFMALLFSMGSFVLFSVLSRFVMLLCKCKTAALNDLLLSRQPAMLFCLCSPEALTKSKL